MKFFCKILIKHNILLLIISAVLTIFSILSLPNLNIGNNKEFWFSKNDQLHSDYTQMCKNFDISRPVVIAYNIKNKLSADDLQYQIKLSKRLKSIPFVRDVKCLGNYLVNFSHNTSTSDRLIDQNLMKIIKNNPFLKKTLISQDLKTLGIVLFVQLPQSSTHELNANKKELTKELYYVLDQAQKEKKQFFHIGGSIIVESKFNEIIIKDLLTFLPISLFLIFFFLIFLFRYFNFVFFPVLSIFLALLWTLGFISASGSFITSLSTALFALIAVIGITDSIHLISYFNYLYTSDTNKIDTLIKTLNESGMACFYTSLTTTAGFFSLMLSPISAIKHFGFFAGFGIISAFLLSMLMFTSAILFSSNINTTKQFYENFLFKNIINTTLFYVNNHAKTIIIISLIIFSIFVFGIPLINTDTTIHNYLKKNSTLRNDINFIQKNLSGISGFSIVFSNKKGHYIQPSSLNEIAKIQSRLNNLPGILTTYSIVDVFKVIKNISTLKKHISDSTNFSTKYYKKLITLSKFSGNMQYLKFLSKNFDKTRISLKTKSLSASQKNNLFKNTKIILQEISPGTQFTITGYDVIVHETSHRIMVTLIKSLGTAFLIILILMCLLFGIKTGLISLIPNIFPIVIVFGVMGYFKFSLNLATVMVSAIAIGIVVDDTIHYFFTFVNTYRENPNYKNALINTHHKIGSAICITSLIIVLGLFLLLLSSTQILIDFSFLSIIVIASASIGDLLLSPVLLKMIYSQKTIKTTQ